MKRIALVISVLALAASTARAACDDHDPLPADYGRPAPAPETKRPGCEPEGWFSTAEVKDAVAAAKTAGQGMDKQGSAPRREPDEFPFEEAKSEFFKRLAIRQFPLIDRLRGEWLLIGVTGPLEPRGHFDPDGLAPVQTLKFSDAGNAVLPSYPEDGKLKVVAKGGTLAAAQGAQKTLVDFSEGSARFTIRDQDPMDPKDIRYDCVDAAAGHLILCRVAVVEGGSTAGGPATVTSYRAFVNVK